MPVASYSPWPQTTWPGSQQWQYPQPTQPNPAVYQRPVQSLIKVTGIEGARAYSLPPNSNAVLFDANEAIFYLKETDGAGFPTLRSFEFRETFPEKPEEVRYATQAEVAKLSEQIAALSQQLEEQKPKEIKLNYAGGTNAQPDIQPPAAQPAQQQHIQQAGQPQVPGLWES